MIDSLILSIFPGIDMLGKGFEHHGFCVVRGPDIITGSDIRYFHVPAGKFGGLIGGPPCQDFSKLNRKPGHYSYLMLSEYIRVVKEATPDWFLFENVACAPDIQISDYHQQRFALDLGWFSSFSRLRYFVFGTKSGILLNPISGKKNQILGTAVTGNDRRSFRACCDIQGLPSDFNLPFFSLNGKKQAVANGVPLQLSVYIAGLIKEAVYNKAVELISDNKDLRCQCGCGRIVVGRALYAGPACRKRAQRCRNHIT